MIERRGQGRYTTFTQQCVSKALQKTQVDVAAQWKNTELAWQLLALPKEEKKKTSRAFSSWHCPRGWEGMSADGRQVHG